MSQDSSLVDAFDLNSETGVMSILASIRGSKLSAPEKNELRDLVFLYTNGGGDASVRLALEQKLATHQIVPVQVRQKVQSGPTLSFGSYRPTPTFRKTPQVATAPVKVVKQVPLAEPASAPIVNEVPQVAPVVTPPVIPVAEPADVVQTIPVAPVVATPVAEPASTVGGAEDYIERIRQIKTAVNSKVGNPVNLVDINNEVGREYMNALLEAMKKLSSGAVSEMSVAMSRLEAAYMAVEAAIVGHNISDASATAPTLTSTPVMRVMPSPAPEAQATTSFSPAPLSEASVASAPVSDLPPRPQPFAESSEPLRAEDRVNEVSSSLSGYGAQPEVAPLIEESQMVAEAPTSFALSDKQKILTPQDLPEVSAVSTSEKVDPLFTREVDDGLNQLLSDWILFRKSGLFGTGPKGREHPLFKKIAGLQVPLLLAGRFDGATQEIRQSITDYMNGWRYEQGIIYQPGETFEKYLRRVIKHIINLQKKHKQP